MARYGDDAGAVAIVQNLHKFVGKTTKAILDASEKVAEMLTEVAQEEHRWEDRTFFLRESTRCDVIVKGQEVTLILHAGSDEDRKNYALFLELFMHGKWTWLWPALRDSADKILDIYKKELNIRLK